MKYLITFGLGLTIATLGMVLPGMVNMAAVSVSLKRGRKAGYQFIAGASFVVMCQSGLALFFTSYLKQHPELITGLQQISIYIFLILALAFFYKAFTNQQIKVKQHKASRRNIARGFGMALANALVIPFFLAVGTWLVAQGQSVHGLPAVICFSIGAGAGALLVFMAYVHSADWVSRHASWLTRNINYVMSGFFLFLAGLQGYHHFG